MSVCRWDGGFVCVFIYRPTGRFPSTRIVSICLVSFSCFFKNSIEVENTFISKWKFGCVFTINFHRLDEYFIFCRALEMNTQLNDNTKSIRAHRERERGREEERLLSGVGWCLYMILIFISLVSATIHRCACVCVYEFPILKFTFGRWYNWDLSWAAWNDN